MVSFTFRVAGSLQFKLTNMALALSTDCVKILSTVAKFASRIKQLHFN